MTNLFLGTNVCRGVMEGYCPHKSSDLLGRGGEVGTLPDIGIPPEGAGNRCDAPSDGAGATETDTDP